MPRSESANSLRLIAALALASHAPTLSTVNEETITDVDSESISDCSSISSRTSTDLESLLNDPVFTQALAHIRESAQTPSARLAFHDPRVVRAIQQACQTMRQPEIAALAQEHSARWNGTSRPKSISGITTKSAPTSLRKRPSTP